MNCHLNDDHITYIRDEFGEEQYFYCFFILFIKHLGNKTKLKIQNIMLLTCYFTREDIRQAWIGLYREPNTSTYKWVDNTSVNWTNWDSG